MFTKEAIAEMVEQSVEKGGQHLESDHVYNAETLLKQARKIAPEDVRILSLLGLALIKQAKYANAIEVYEDLLKLEPNNLDGINNLSLSYSKTGEKQKAIALLEKGLDLDSKRASFWYHLAIQYKELNDFQRAFDIYEDAIREIEGSVELHYHYGVTLAEFGNYDKSIEQYTLALECDPNHTASHWNLSLMCLLKGNYKDGFLENEWRFSQFPTMMKAKSRFHGKPDWKPVPGKGKILFYNEQGLGDLLQMIRYMPLVKDLGYETLIEAPTSLFDLITQTKGVDEVVAYRSAKTPPYDYAVSINSLPLLFGTTLETVPADIPYLKPTGKIDAAEFKQYLSKKKIGICWAGSPYHASDHLRSCRLSEFSGISKLPNVKLFSLQKETSKRFHVGIGAVDLTEDCDEDLSVVDMSDLMQDFNYTAAIIDGMDLIITVDTAIAHLAGGMGKECWVLVPAMPDWRWGQAISPWYPNTRIFRQNHGEKWCDVFKRVVEELKA
jgi:tetratricopeptide (TPR) repeat protein